MKKLETSTEIHPKTLLVAIQAPYNPLTNIDSYYEEFVNLVKSNQLEFDQVIYMKLRSIDTAYFLTSGKLEELIKVVKDNNIEEVIFSEPLTAQQERNLNEMLRARVFDRTQLILEIFEKGAHSAEGKTQVQLALLQHKKSRLAGKGIHMSQQAGRIGTRGPGETAKEKEMQHIDRQVHKFKQDLEKLAQHRETQRKKRLEYQIPHIALIGYTNAGKSTLLNQLTKSDVLTEDKLFATLDTTTRELYIDGKKIGVISDTVGFIQLLPHKLIEAFKSTLAELQYAHLLLHVIDISDPNWQEHIKVVQEILAELDVDKPVLYVFNKSDKIELNSILESSINHYQPHVIISSLSPQSLKPLVKFIKQWKKKMETKHART